MFSEHVDVLDECTGITGVTWKVCDAPYRNIVMVQQKLGLSEIVARILTIRGVSVEEIRDFLNPTLRNLMPDPFHLLDMDKAVSRIYEAIHNGEGIAVFGDYDVDGATSSAVLHRYFSSLGVRTRIYIPDRIEEGYGPNAKALLTLKEEGFSVCITVDCGTMAHEPIAAAKAAGLDVIVVDHHIGSRTLPDAIAVINPNRIDETSTYTYLSGVGTVFLLLVALHKVLRKKDFFLSRAEPDLMRYLDLVALGTVCDVMPMIQLNRAYVRHGLKVMAERSNTGLKVLIDAIGIEDKPSVYHLGFCIGPHINAGGRIGNSGLGANLLSSDDEIVCSRIASTLLRLNVERKAIEDKSLEEALQQAKRCVNEGKNLIIVAGAWHEGVIGIVAGRLKETFFLPTIVISLNGKFGKGSARSVSDIDIGAAILDAKLHGIIIEGGGHAMAAGFSIEVEKIDELYTFLLKRFEAIQICRVMHACGILSVGALTLSLCRELQLLEPFGPGNAEPKFILKNVYIKQPTIVGMKHIKFWIDGDGDTVRGMCFRSVGTELGMALFQKQKVSLLGRVGINQWRCSEYVQFTVDDVAISTGT